ncbi:endonuclease/exonuclease/phosphatase family protein [Nocardioides houyundeii]|uniref:endonuclease/exonuclease/phosphatase family protein n=1 Tax=Nocardioides houyundeii TaxID=2045452 RepID=UPI000C76BD95|nr:endonuclease/exonuclease/phosphatase family protein [Nocardioides houyundeii]
MRVTTFNILHGRSPDDDQVDLARFCEAIASLDADVLALQEVDRNQARSAGADLTALAAEAMGAQDHLFVAALHGNPGVWMAADGDEQPDAAGYGVALLSRYPVTAWQTIRLAPVPVRVPMFFPGSRRPEMVQDEARVAVAATIESPLGPVTVANTHLTFIEWWQRRQLRTLRQAFEARTTPLILAGDLNMGPARAARLTGLAALAAAPTFPADVPGEQLDHLLGTPDLAARVTSSRAQRLALSDHRALSVDLRPTT